MFTKADWERLPEGFPAQLVGGQLLREPAPTYGHEHIRMRLVRLLVPLVPDGLLVVAPVDVLVDEHNVFQPDIAVLGSVPRDDTSYVGTPRVVFEILSPSTASRDRDLKTPRLLELGVREVWLVDPRSREIVCRAAAGARSARGNEAIASEIIAGFSVRPSALFTRPRGA